jgi:hypothetical protein
MMLMSLLRRLTFADLNHARHQIAVPRCAPGSEQSAPRCSPALCRRSAAVAEIYDFRNRIVHGWWSPGMDHGVDHTARNTLTVTNWFSDPDEIVRVVEHCAQLQDEVSEFALEEMIRSPRYSGEFPVRQ